MNLFQIALENLKRRKIKTMLLCMAIAMGVSLVVSMFSIVEAMRLELGNELDKFGPNIVITPRFQGQEIYAGQTVAFDVKPLTESDLPVIRTIPDKESVNIISPKLVGSVTLEDRTVILVGMDNEQEFTMKPWFELKEWIGNPGDVEPAELSSVDIPENGLILGHKIAESFQAEVGGTLSVNGEEFLVAGILEKSGSDEDGLIFADLPVVQRLLGREGVFSMIEVSGFCNFCPIEDMASQMTEIMPNARVTALRQAALVREETIRRFEAFGYLFSVVAILVTVLYVITSMLSSVNERTLEIGIFRAIGFRRLHIIKLILLEGFMVSMTAGIIGFFSGEILTRIAGPYLARIPVSMPLNVELILPTIFFAVIIALLSTLYPAIKAANLDPMEALRFV